MDHKRDAARKKREQLSAQQINFRLLLEIHATVGEVVGLSSRHTRSSHGGCEIAVPCEELAEYAAAFLQSSCFILYRRVGRALVDD